MRCRPASPAISSVRPIGLNYVLMTIIAGLLYIAITFVGVRGLHYIGLVSVPLFVVLGIWVAVDAVATPRLGGVMSYAGNNGVGAMSMGVGLTVVLTLFIDAGTVTADFNRWAKDLDRLAGLDLQRVSLRQSGRDAGRRHHDGGAGDAQRQSVRRRQHVRLHERQANHLAVGACLHLPLLQSRLGLLALSLQCSNRAGRAFSAATCAFSRLR